MTMGSQRNKRDDFGIFDDDYGDEDFKDDLFRAKSSSNQLTVS